LSRLNFAFVVAFCAFVCVSRIATTWGGCCCSVFFFVVRGEVNSRFAQNPKRRENEEKVSLSLSLARAKSETKTRE
jgi:hypothetical protein